MEYSDLTEVAETAGKIFVLIAAVVLVFVLVFAISGDTLPGGGYAETVLGVVSVIVWPGVALLVFAAVSELFRRRNQAIPGF